MRTRRFSPYVLAASKALWTPEIPDIMLGLTFEKSNGAPPSSKVVVGEDPEPKKGPKGSESPKENVCELLALASGEGVPCDWAGEGRESAAAICVGLMRSSGVEDAGSNFDISADCDVDRDDDADVDE